MAGVPGVFWRCPAVLKGPSTHNPTLVLRKTLILKNWPIFPICMWKWGGSAPSGQARVSRPNWPQCAKSHAAWQSLSSRAEKLRIFSKTFFYFLTIFLVFCDFLPFSRCWPYFEAGMLFGGFGSTRVTKFNVGCRENPYFEKLADLWQIWPYSRYRGQIHTCSPGRLQGHLWVILTIGSCFYGSF